MILSLQYGLFGQPIPKPTFIRIQKLILTAIWGGVFGQHEAAEYERPHFLRALSITPGAHANSLNVSYGYARTCTRSWPIRPSLLTDQSRHLNARHAQAVKGYFYSHSHVACLNKNDISSHRSEGYIVSNTFSRLINQFWPWCHFELRGSRHGRGLFVEQTDSLQ